MTSKFSLRALSLSLLMVLIMALLVPNMGQAATTTNERPERPERETGNRGQRAERLSTSSSARPAFICSSIDTVKAKILGKFDERAAKMETKKEDRADKPGRDARKAKLAEGREQRETQREERYTVMRNKATTTEQKAAVEAFIASVEALVMKRQAAVDVAIETFETSVASLKPTGSETLEAQKAAAKADIEAVFAAVKSNCTDSSSGEAIRAEIKSGLEAIHQKQMPEKDGSKKAQFEALRAARAATVKIALDDFQTGMDAAKATLKNGFQKPVI